MRIQWLLVAFLCVSTQRLVSGFPDGSGTWEDPYWIRSAANLIALGEDPNLYDKHFILTADIDLDPNLPGGRIFDRAVVAADQNEVQEGFQGPGFSGRFDGNGHFIENLYIQGSHYLGLFGRLTDEARVFDLGLKGVSVRASGRIAGGLAAWNDSGTVDTCLSIGAVAAQGHYAGGLIGFNGGHVSHCYSMGTVQGSGSVGGLVGANSGGFIAFSYSTAHVTGQGRMGGLAGYNHLGRITLSFWDTDASGMAFSDGGVGLSTTEMQDPEMVGLNGLAQDPRWVLDAHLDYPRLAWEESPGSMIRLPDVDWLEGSGTPDAPYRISALDQLTALSKAGALMDRYFILGADLDLDGVLWPQSVMPDFSGRFDGDGFSIRHLRIQGNSGLGLFGYVDTHAFVTGVVLEAVDVNGVGDRVGSFAGFNRGTLSDCHTTGNIRGRSAIAGLVGWNEGRIESSSSDTSTAGQFDTGGLVGINRGPLAANHCSGQVQGWGGRIGGLVGFNIDYALSDCFSTGAVSGRNQVGGLVGTNSGGTLSRCYNTGTVEGKDQTGGLLGSNSQQGIVSGCTNMGTVSGDDDVGGLAGYNSWVITECSNRASVKGTGDVGGLVGSNTESITSCFSDGRVEGESVGGLVGSSQGRIADCFSTGDVSGAIRRAGGLVGFNRGEITHCYSVGLVAGDETLDPVEQTPGQEEIGGLVGEEIETKAVVTASFWDTDTSGLDQSRGGTGLTTVEMQDINTFVGAGWDFIGADDNGTADIWWINDGQDYPRLWWELVPEN